MTNFGNKIARTIFNQNQKKIQSYFYGLEQKKKMISFRKITRPLKKRLKYIFDVWRLK